MSDITITFLIIIAAVILFMQNKLPVVIVAMGVAFSLYATGVLSLQDSFAGFGDPAIIFIATLFIVSAGLEATGVTAWVGQILIRLSGEDSRPRLITFTIILVSLLTAAISVNGAVAALLPVVVVMAIRVKIPPSQLLMPLAFGAHAGSMLALSGTPVSVLVNDALVDAGGKSFGFFEFAWVGIPMVIGTIAIIALFGQRLLPNTQGPNLPSDFSQHAHTLVEQYRLEGELFRLRLRDTSPLVGKLQTEVDLSWHPGLALIGIETAQGVTAPQPVALAAGDSLILKGEADAAASFAGSAGLAMRNGSAEPAVSETLFNRDSGLAEVIIPPRSRFVGETAFPGQSTESGDLIVLAVQRGGLPLGPGSVVLAAGDTMLLQGTWKALDHRLSEPGVMVVDSPAVVRKQAVPLGVGSKAAILTLLAMVILLAFNLVPPAIAGLIAATAMILTKVLSVEESYRAINWTTIILVGAMMPLSTAMFQTGAAQLLADTLISLLGDAGPRALLIGLFIITAVLGQVISNMATALIVIPIAVLAARGLDVSPIPVLMSVNVAAAASFLTPIATPVNLMVMGPAGYQFGDYWKLGLPLMLLFFVVSVFLVPVIWPF